MFLIGDLDQTPFNCVRRLTYQMIIQRVNEDKNISFLLSVFRCT